MRRDLPLVGYYPSDVSQYQGLFSNCCGQRMVPPRLNVGATKYWLRARNGTRNGGKIIVSVDSLYNIFKESRVSKKRTEASSVSQNVPASPDIPALRKSARLLEKRAALLRCTRGGQYWQRTRSKGNKRSLLVSVKSLYTSDSPEKEAEKTASCSGCARQTPRRKSARLFEKRAASLLSCRTGRPGGVRPKISKFKRKRKHICWLYKGTPWMGGAYSKMHSSELPDRRRGHNKSECVCEMKSNH